MDTQTLTRRAEPPSHGERLASFAAKSYDSGARTFEAVLSTGAPVKRFGYIEELVITAEAMQLDRVASRIVPLLDSHRANEIDRVLGKVESVRIEAGKLIGRIRFADTEAGRRAEGMVARGEIAAVSIGYAVHRWEIAESRNGQPETWRSVSWELIETSLVSMPADPAALIRSEGPNIMTRTAETTAPRGESNEAHVTARAIASAARNAGLNGDALDELLELHEGQPMTRAALMGEIGTRWAQRDSAAPTTSRIDPYRNSGREVTAQRMTDALYARMSGTAPTEGAREFMSMSFAGLARQALQDAGHDTRTMADHDIITRSLNTTSDFPNLLLGAGNRYLLDVFEAAQSQVLRLARKRTAHDFRPINNIQLSEAAALELVNEHGELKYDTFSEGKESYSVSTFGKIFGLSRQAMINDDLGAFSDPLRLMGRAAAETQATQLTALLTANSGNGATMADGNPLFHTASHKNKAATGAAISLTTVSAGRTAMRNQMDIGGKVFMNAVPKFLLVGSDNETLAQQVVASITPATWNNANPFSGMLEVAVDPRLPSTSWRMFADPATYPVIEYAYLSGYEGPQLAMREGFTVLGAEYKVVLDFGCGVIDYRGAYLDPGV